jgi:hypothetical protein
MGRLSMILAAIGFPTAAVGLTIYGMATSYAIRDDSMASTATLLMVAGMVAGIVGVIGYRASERKV